MLAILVGILEGVSMLMLAANRELLDDEPPPYWRPLPPTATAADNILRHIDRLRCAVDAYRRVALPKPPPEPSSDDLPF